MNLVGTISAGIFLASLILIEIYRSPKLVAALKKRISEGDTSARTEFYKRTVLSSWAAAALALVIMLVSGLSLTTIGFAGIHGVSSEYVASFLIGAVPGICIVSYLLWRQSQNPEHQQPILGDIEFLLPRTRNERHWWVAVAVTAGIAEEVYFRALPIQFFNSLVPGSSLLMPVILSAIAFGIGHTYQGVKGVVGTGVLGLGLGAIYAFTGSLLPGMAIHILIDLRILLVRLPERVEAES